MYIFALNCLWCIMTSLSPVLVIFTLQYESYKHEKWPWKTSLLAFDDENIKMNQDLGNYWTLVKERQTDLAVSREVDAKKEYDDLSLTN